MKALDKIREIYEALDSSGIEGADKEAELIVSHVLDIDLADLYKDNPSLNSEQTDRIEEIAGRRRRREPLQYILGYVDFMGLRIKVGKGVLVPRPETELMAEIAIKMLGKRMSHIKKRTSNIEHRTSNVEYITSNFIERTTDDGSRITVLDLCTGSGCLALALAKAFSDAHVYGTDISETAINYANSNAEINKLNNIRFIKGHLFEPLGDDQAFDMIISNPPYIKTEDIETLQPEVRDWEPAGALDGGRDGLDFYREIIPAARTFLKDNGILMLELGEGCSDDTVGMMKDAGYTGIKVYKDYSGIERIVEAVWTR